MKERVSFVAVLVALWMVESFHGNILMSLVPDDVSAQSIGKLFLNFLFLARREFVVSRHVQGVVICGEGFVDG